MPAKRQRPLGPNPKDRPNWSSMNEGQKRYAMEQWKLARVRRGEYFNPPGEEKLSDEQFEYLNDFDLSFLGTPLEEVNQSDLPTSQEEAAAEDFINQLSNMDTDDVSSSGSIQTGVKRARTDPPMDAKGSAKHGTSLPGTGGNLGGMTEGGSSVPVPIFKPIGRHTEKFTQTFHKKWRFLTSANANVILLDKASTGPIAHPERWALTTALANIPWEYAFFYMTPAEFKRMSSFPGAKAKNCKVTVKSWNTRVAFQTGDTQTSNATLNQNKFIQIGKGLRSCPYLMASDRQYNFEATEPMKPIGFQSVNSAAHREQLKGAMYGYDNDDDTRVTQAPPSDSTGAEIYIRDYLTVYTLKKNPDYKPGFPQLKNLIEEYDASACINQVVAALDYDFDYAPLTPNWAAVPYYDVTDTQPTTLAAGNKVEGLTMKTHYPAQNAGPLLEHNFTRKYLQGPRHDDTYFTEEQNYSVAPLEQSGLFEELNSRGYTDSQQPSLHVGIRAVPKLTTIDTGIQATSFLDAQGYFEVEAELTVESFDDYTHIRQGCFAPATKGQLQIFANNRPLSYSFDYPNFFGRMAPRVIPVIPTNKTQNKK